MTLEDLKNHLLDGGKVYRKAWRDEKGNQILNAPIYAEVVAGSLVAYYPNGEKTGQRFSMVIAKDWEIYTSGEEVSSYVEPCYVVMVFGNESFIIRDKTEIRNSEYCNTMQQDPNIMKMWDNVTKMELLEALSRLPAEKQILNRRPKPEVIKAQKIKTPVSNIWDIIKLVVSSDFITDPTVVNKEDLADKLADKFVEFVHGDYKDTPSISRVLKYQNVFMDTHGNVTLRYAVYNSSDSDEIEHYIDFDLTHGKAKIINKEEV